MTSSKIVAAAASGAGGGAGLDVDEVFSTFLWDGNGSSQTIVNGIDLAGEGGLVWEKVRNQSYPGGLYDTERGVLKQLRPDNTDVTNTRSGSITSFNSNGFSIGNDAYQTNGSGNTYVSWTFRKAPKFFDIVTYSGNGSNRAISHNLGSVPGMIIVKGYDRSDGWAVYHRGTNGGTNPENYATFLSGTNAQSSSSAYWNNTAPTSTQFTVGTEDMVNNASNNYIAYIFAHNNNDGGFGPDGDADIIKCGSYTGNGNADGPTVDLGFEPQWVLLKDTTNSTNWHLHDNMRGLPVGGNDATLYANRDFAEAASAERLNITPTGFKMTTTTSGWNANNANMIYMAIRRGPLAAPDDATKVFKASLGDSTVPGYNAPFAVDMAFNRYKVSTAGNNIYSRLTGPETLDTASTAASASDSSGAWDFMDGWYDGGRSSDFISWMWKRAPSYFDVVAYSGTGSAMTINHNLGAVPEMMWVKNRSNSSYNWNVYHKDLSSGDMLFLSSTSAAVARGYFNNTAPTSTVFSVGVSPIAGPTSASGENFIAYLFATAPGVSKVGSVSPTGSALTVDCGFSNGCRFLLMKRTDDAGDFFVWDSVRGINAGAAGVGNDPYLKLNDTSAETSSTNYISPHSSGFTLTSEFWGSGSNFIFYAIA